MSTTLEAVKKGIAFIEANLQHSIGVSDVADAVSYSQFYFSREFSRHTHITIYDYILRRKISEAYKYLFGTGGKIVDLAFRHGFQSHEVFTRAFRKMFGENPSEATIYKPLAVYEAIDDRYLEFLYGLRTEISEENAVACCFEIDAATNSEDYDCSLMLLYKENLYNCKSVFNGYLTADESRGLTFRLNNLKKKIRVNHTDQKYAFRYFLDNAYDVGEMGCNYILLKREDQHLDFYIPNAFESNRDKP